MDAAPLRFCREPEKEIDLQSIDFVVANHGECDHSGSLTALMAEIPEKPIYCTANAVKSIEGQYGKRGWQFHVVKTGDSVEIGNGKKLVFVEMRMLHWPDSMATYMTGDNILFSNDAFGQHYAVEELFNDRADQCLLEKEAMKYFANILNPFAQILTKKLTEISGFNLPIDLIARPMALSGARIRCKLWKNTGNGQRLIKKIRSRLPMIPCGRAQQRLRIR